MYIPYARDHHRRIRQQRLELRREVVDRLDHQQIELARRIVGSRQSGKRLAPIDELPELGFGHLPADQHCHRPGGDEHDRDRPGEDRRQSAEVGERRRVEEQQQAPGEEGGEGRCPQRRNEDLPHDLRLRSAPGRAPTIRTSRPFRDRSTVD